MSPTDQAFLRRLVKEHTPQKKPRSSRTQLASVAIVLSYPKPDKGPEVLFIKRANHPKDPWSGHMAFPGGRQQPDDADDLAAAIRETREEVGLCLDSHGSLLGRLDDCQAIARGGLLDMLIAPFVFLVDDVPELHLQAGEVEAVHWFPLEELLAGTHATEKEYRRGEETFRLPAWRVAGETVWGLTYTMMQSFLSVLRSASRCEEPTRP